MLPPLLFSWQDEAAQKALLLLSFPAPFLLPFSLLFLPALRPLIPVADFVAGRWFPLPIPVEGRRRGHRYRRRNLVAISTAPGRKSRRNLDCPWQQSQLPIDLYKKGCRSRWWYDDDVDDDDDDDDDDDNDDSSV